MRPVALVGPPARHVQWAPHMVSDPLCVALWLAALAAPFLPVNFDDDELDALARHCLNAWPPMAKA